MKTFIAVLLVVCVGVSARKLETQQAFENGLHPFSRQMVYLINNAQKSWTASQHFTEGDLETVKARLGAVLEHDHQLPEVNVSSHLNLDAPIPKEFDARKQWSQCAEIVGDIRDQANCGSCWAFAAVGAMSDRICIASNGQKKVRVSADDLLSCCTLMNSFSFCGFGCNGGIVPLAWRYWVKKGIVSGGNWHDKQPTCRPYEIEPCGKHNKERDHKCSGTAPTPKCVKKCVNNADYNQDKSYGASSYTLKGAENIQREIMQHGSVEAAFTVMSDFPQYAGGVYQATTSNALGGHAVRIIGWGVDNGTPYWLIANSWSDIWGEKGYFRILRGANHCGIEGAIAAGLPKL